MLISLSTNKKNIHFDLLRLILSLTVFGAHLIGLSNHEELYNFSVFFPSTLAVEIFFVLSGFFVAYSYERSATLKLYFSKRFRRMAPAYIFIVTASSFLWLFVEHDSTDFLSAISSILKYYLLNLTTLNFLAPSYLNIFSENLNKSINGALWTIKIEIMFYFLIPILSHCYKILNPFRATLILFTASIIYKTLIVNYLSLNYHDILLRQLPGQLSFFAVGLYLYYAESVSIKNFVVLFFVTFSLFIILNDHDILKSIAIGFFLFLLSVLFKTLEIKMRLPDFSYSLYLCHFPILQTLLSFKLFNDNYYLYIFTSILLTISFAIFITLFIENRFLKHSSRN